MSLRLHYRMRYGSVELVHAWFPHAARNGSWPGALSHLPRSVIVIFVVCNFCVCLL
jgi:hypothetical protein